MIARPAESIARVPVIDALRGFALFGVIGSNVVVLTGAGALGPRSAFDDQFGTWMSYLVTGKFLALFSLLFGVSFGLYLVGCAREGRPPAARFLRRMGVLFVIGAAHRVLGGVDILMTYAVLGAVLLLLRNAPNRLLLTAAVLSLALPELWRVGSQAAGLPPPAVIATRAERTRLAVEGPYIDLAVIRARMLAQWWRGFLAQDTAYAALFLAGLVAARRRLLDDAEAHKTTWRILWWGGLGLTLAGYGAQSYLRPMLTAAPSLRTLFGIVWVATTFVQGIAYAAGLVLLWMRRGIAQRALAACVAAGRMALTHYLTASILVTAAVAMTGTFGAPGVAAAFTLGAAIWLLQLVVSMWWLRAHRSGPAEWLWRKVARA